MERKRKYTREQLKGFAHDAALETCARLDLELLTEEERETVLAVAENFFRKWFNGRPETLMSPDYLIAEASDEVFWRHETYRLELAAAIATLCFTFYEERIQPELTEGTT